MHTDVAAAKQEQPRGPNTHMTEHLSMTQNMLSLLGYWLFEKNASTINGHLQHHFTFSKKKTDILEFISFERYFNEV